MGFFDWFAEETDQKNKFVARPPQLDRNNYSYGGTPGGADEAAGRYRQQAEQAQLRRGEQVDYGQANQDRAMGMQARAGQAGIADLMAARARGQVPSIAQMQADRQMGQATAAQASQAASARGAAGLALAQQGAANNLANMHGSISNQAQINAAQERMQAEQAASGAFANLRGGDMASQQMSAQQAQYQAQLNAQQRAQNDAYDISKTNAEMGVRNAQMTGGMNYEAQRSSNEMGAQGINAGIGGQNAQTNQGLFWGSMGLARDLGGLAFKAAGGPVAPGAPYIVGEQGPELIIPGQSGTVIPAGPTAGILRMNAVNAGSGPGASTFAGQAGMLGGSPIGEMKAHSDFATRYGRHAGSNPLDYGGGRAEGGPVQAGTGYVVGENGPEAFVPSTWGAGGLARMQQAAAVDAHQNWGHARDYALDRNRDAAPMQLSGGLAVAGFTPGIPMSKTEPLDRRDDAVARAAEAKRAYGVEMTGREEYEAEGAERRQAQARANEQKSKSDAKKAAAEKAKATVPAKREDTIDRMIRAGAPAYTPMGGYVAPQLLQVPSVISGHREEGGPVAAGKAYVAGERGPEVMLMDDPRLHQSLDGHAYLYEPPASGARLSGGGLSGMSASPPVVARAPIAPTKSPTQARKMTDEEMAREAEKMLREMREEHEAYTARGPAVGIARMR